MAFPAKSRQAKQASGNYRKSRDPGVSTSRLQPLATVPRPPEHLTDDECKVWNRLSPAVQGVITSADLESFAIACVTVARLWATVRDPDATLTEVRLAATGAQAQLAHFGCSPASRERVPVLQSRKPSSELDEFDR